MRAALALVMLAAPAAAQFMGGPPLPEVAWKQALGAELPLDARFVDHTGRALALSECLAERPVVLALVYYECPMLCGLVLEGLVQALRAVDFTTGEDFTVLVASIDPEETPELAAKKRASVLAAYGLEESDPAAAAWRFLVGEEREIRALADAVGFVFSYVPERDEWAHPAGITVLTPEGRVSRVLFGAEFAPRDVRLALVEAARSEIGTPLDQVLLRCFHYDPARGKYGLAIIGLLRVLGIATVALLAIFVVRWIRNEPGSAALQRGPGTAGLQPGDALDALRPRAALERGGPRAGLEPGAPSGAPRS